MNEKQKFMSTYPIVSLAGHKVDESLPRNEHDEKTDERERRPGRRNEQTLKRKQT